MIEFFLDADGAIILRTKENGVLLFEELTQSNTDTIEAMLNCISNFYPEAYKMLLIEVAQAPRQERNFAMVHRFISCNFGALDGTPDIDKDGNFHFEEVQCPIRKYCKANKIICSPKFHPSTLSNRHVDVIAAILSFATEQEAADALFISQNTLKNHKRAIFNATGTTNVNELIIYALNNKMKSLK